MNTKTCADCEKEKPLEEFVRDPRAPTGCSSYCKECKAARSRRRRARTSAAQEAEDQRRALQEVTPMSAKELRAVEDMAAGILAHRRGELPEDPSGSPLRAPSDPVDELQEEIGFSGKRWHRLCSIALDLADAQEDVDTVPEKMEAAA